MNRKRHWTVYAIIGIILITIISVIGGTLWTRQFEAFEVRVSDAGGAVIYEDSHLFSFGPVNTTFQKPTSVEISSGSHPLPSLKELKYFPSIKSLSLNTSQIGEKLNYDLSLFRHIEVMDLTSTEVGNIEAQRILSALPHLKELHVSQRNFSTEETETLRTSAHGSKIIMEDHPISY